MTEVSNSILFKQDIRQLMCTIDSPQLRCRLAVTYERLTVISRTEQKRITRPNIELQSKMNAKCTMLSLHRSTVPMGVFCNDSMLHLSIICNENIYLNFKFCKFGFLEVLLYSVIYEI